MRVLVCGSRTFEDAIIEESVLDGLWALHEGELVIIEGGADGADWIAGSFADSNDIKHEQYPADWETHGKAAGPIRNQQMLDEGKPDMVLAFVDKNLEDSRGTADMVRRALKAGIPVTLIHSLG